MELKPDLHQIIICIELMLVRTCARILLIMKYRNLKLIVSSRIDNRFQEEEVQKSS